LSKLNSGIFGESINPCFSASWAITPLYAYSLFNFSFRLWSFMGLLLLICARWGRLRKLAAFPRVSDDGFL